jgi:hypothetical protein
MEVLLDLRQGEDCSTSCELIGYPAGDSLVRLSAPRYDSEPRAEHSDYRAWGSSSSAEIFAEGTSYHDDKVGSG